MDAGKLKLLIEDLRKESQHHENGGINEVSASLRAADYLESLVEEASLLVQLLSGFFTVGSGYMENPHSKAGEWLSPETPGGSAICDSNPGLDHALRQLMRDKGILDGPSDDVMSPPTEALKVHDRVRLKDGRPGKVVRLTPAVDLCEVETVLNGKPHIVSGHPSEFEIVLGDPVQLAPDL